MIKNKKLWVVLLIIPMYIVVKLATNYPETVEVIYSKGIYPYIAKLFRYTLGWIPFSIGDVFLGFSIIYAIRWLILNFKRIWKDTVNWLLDVGATVSIIFIAFQLLWGLNYHRVALHKTLDLEDDYSTQQLIEVTKQLIKKSNALHLDIVKNDSIKVVLPFTRSEILELTPTSYDVLKNDFPELAYHPKSLKKSLFSYPQAYMGFAGYFNPLTHEAQVNYLIPVYKYPTTSAHEVAHQLGYAKENEANFIAFLATISNQNMYFKYSGYTFGLRHCLGEVYRRDPDLYDTLLADINKGIIKNFQESRQFWLKYMNPLEPFFRSTYTTYLKANNQSKGMDSYSYVVALLVNYLENKTL
ncbi:DUF3810 domain-containing protein [Olleya sp. ITB9]|uniref:DUF3810 domain-containing protein n=1 Tax=Olleya sp. ITB9 TaxID=1715648 RepID=UPI0006D1E5A5|nr:DUF3810 domain-containing protein [Olleya sp. ITB9]